MDSKKDTGADKWIVVIGALLIYTFVFIGLGYNIGRKTEASVSKLKYELKMTQDKLKDMRDELKMTQDELREMQDELEKIQEKRKRYNYGYIKRKIK
jgi:cell division protein FtsB